MDSARSLIQQQRAKQQQQQSKAIDSAQQQPVMKLGDRDSYTGKFALNSGAGTETNRATKIYDARADNQPVLAHQLPGGSWVADGHKAIEGDGIVGPLEPDNPGYFQGQIFTEKQGESEGLPVKYLFSVLRGGKPEFYVGGWKSKSVKVPIPEADRSLVYNLRLTNLGGDKWLVTYKLSTTIADRFLRGYTLKSGSSTPTEFTLSSTDKATLSDVGFGQWSSLAVLNFPAGDSGGNANYSITSKYSLGGNFYTASGEAVALFADGLLAAGSRVDWQAVINSDLIIPGYFLPQTTDISGTTITQAGLIKTSYLAAAGKSGAYGIVATQEGSTARRNSQSFQVFTGNPNLHAFNQRAILNFPTPKLSWFNGATISAPLVDDYNSSQGLAWRLFASTEGYNFDVISASKFAVTSLGLTELRNDQKATVEFYDSTFQKSATKKFKCFRVDRFNDNSTTAFTMYNFSYNPDTGSGAKPPTSRLGY